MPAPNQTAHNAPMQNPPMQTPPAATTSPASNNRGAAGGDFATLAGAEGYITQSDAMRDHWMTNHFQQCDSDHDGKVTRIEFEACHQSNGSAPPMSGQ